LVETEKMLMVELNVPRYVWKHISNLTKKIYRDVVIELTKARTTSICRVFIKDCPRGWWVALKILREGSGKLYILREVKYLDIPSKVMELSVEQEWKPEYEKIIEEELRKWGLKNE